MATSSAVGRVAAIVAVVGVLVIVGFLLLGRGSSYEVTADFQNASQLVKGNLVEVAGTKAGTVKSISLGDHGEALVKMKVSGNYAPLHRGTTAVVRSQSLSGIANRYVELNLPATGKVGAPIPNGGVMTQKETVSEVDLDQLFNTLDPQTVRNFKNVITGFAIAYDGVGPQTNKGFHYANPLLSTSRRLFGELNSDQPALESLIVDTASLTSALDARYGDTSSFVHNASVMFGAIGRQNRALAQALGDLPDFMRNFNTTAVNTRATLDDLDPLVAASKPVAKKLRPFARNLRGFSRDAVPTIKDLNRTIKRPGANNDLIELTKLQVPLARIAVGPVSRNGAVRQGAFPASTASLTDSLPQLAFFRAYTPELVGWFDDFGHSGSSDAVGSFARVASTFNAFSPLALPVPSLGAALGQIATAVAVPLVGPALLSALQVGYDRRCPGTLERDPGDGSTPFTDNGTLDCNPNQLPAGP